jgi:hypothetical protein
MEEAGTLHYSKGEKNLYMENYSVASYSNAQKKGCMTKQLVIQWLKEVWDR